MFHSTEYLGLKVGGLLNAKMHALHTANTPNHIYLLPYLDCMKQKQQKYSIEQEPRRCFGNIALASQWNALSCSLCLLIVVGVA